MDSPGSYAPEAPHRAPFILPARPDALRLVAAETALIIVDMQNAYASPGGYIDLAGFDVTGAAPVIPRIAQVAATARAAGMPVIFFQNWVGPRLCRGGRAGVAQFPQVERAQDHAPPA